MATTALARIKVYARGDIDFGQEFSTAQNLTSPMDMDIVTLVMGANTITKPAGAVGCVIIPIAGIALTLKGVAGDTGVLLSTVDPNYVSLAAGQANFVLNASGAGTCRIIFI